MTRVGLIARANEKGLGTQTLSASLGYKFDSTLLVLDNNRRVLEHPEWYPDAHVAHYDVVNHTLDQDPNDRGIEAFLDEVDTIFSVETLYDWGLADYVRSRKPPARTVVQGNPEFYTHHHHPDRPHPDVWTWPTNWMLDRVAKGPVIPVPVMAGCWASPGGANDDVTVVHVAGHRANGDRNGTILFCQALRYVVGVNVNVRIYAQDGVIPELPRLGAGLNVEMYPHGANDRWAMYDGAHLLIMPRRYGGLCLPVQEAMTAGLAVSMTDCSPNMATWPVRGIRGGRGRAIRVPLGDLLTAVADPRLIGKEIVYLAQRREILADQMARSRGWAETHTWDALRPTYDKLFGR